MGDIDSILTNVGLNLVTGGLYSVGKAALSDDPLQKLMTQGFDLGLAAVGNQLTVDVLGPGAGMIFNAAGGALGAAGAAGAFSGLPGFTPGGVAPLAAGAPSAAPSGVAALAEGGPITATGTATPLAPGVMGSTSGADLAGATLTGPVGAPAVPTVAAPLAPGSEMISMGSNSGLTAKDYGTLTQSIDRIKAGADAGKEAAMWSPEVKAALTMGGTLAAGQMLTGSMGGLFAGLSAQKQLELQQLINDQNQQQIQYRNKNNAYSPLVKFKKPAGLIQPV
jgi:hypothetical protein